MSRPDKQFKLDKSQIKPLIEAMGFCFATDRITVDGCKIGYMYREEPMEPEDSGWRFFAGDEADDYLDDAQNTGIYSVNTLANYDPDIIPFLEHPAPIRFCRNKQGQFEVLER